MKKKKIIISLIIVIFIIISVILINYDSSEKVVLMDEEKEINASSSISMMLETKLDSGIYEVSSDSSWPTSGYVFNETLSSCENGSSLSWDSDANAVIFSGAVADRCYIYFDKESTLVNFVLSQYSTDGVNKLYYFDGEGDYTNADLEAGDYSYRYSGSDYLLTEKATEAGYSTITNTRTTSDDDITSTGFINFYCNGTLSFVGYGCSSGYDYYYVLDYDIYETQYSTYQDVLQQAISDVYVESDYLNNFVCFGSDSETCEEDNLYRIIGIFLNGSGNYEVKLIKYSYASSGLLGTDGDYSKEYTSFFYSGSRISSFSSSQSRYYWNRVNYDSSFSDTGYYNDWSYSQLNTVNLNINYLGSLDTTWQEMIVTHTWIVGGNTNTNMHHGTAYSSYQAELVNFETSQVTTTYDSKAGLIYVSDYYYSVDPIYWSYPGYNSNHSKDYATAKDSNWMYMGIQEWTITRSSSNSTVASRVINHGYVATSVDINTYLYAV